MQMLSSNLSICEPRQPGYNYAFLADKSSQYSIEILLGLDVLERLLLLIHIDDVYILFLRMPLNKVLENITLANTTRPHKYNDIAFPDP